MFGAIAAVIMLIALIHPEQMIASVKNGMDLCCEVIIPGLFPFFILSGILIYSGFPKLLARPARPFMRPLFNVNENGASAFVIGLISGCPAGAVTACELYSAGYVSKSEAERLLGFCSNSGPLFIIGSVGAAMYSSVRTGAALYAVHAAAGVITGILLSFYARDRHTAPEYKLEQPRLPFAEVYSRTVRSAAENMILVCASVIFFSTVTELVTGLLPISSGALFGAAKGLLEFTNGIKIISVSDASYAEKLILTAFSAGFAGLCVHMQVISVAAKNGLGVKAYIIGKVLHGVLSAAGMWAVLKLTPMAAEVSGIAAAFPQAADHRLISAGIAAVLCAAGCIAGRKLILKKGENT